MLHTILTVVLLSVTSSTEIVNSSILLYVFRAVTSRELTYLLWRCEKRKQRQQQKLMYQLLLVISLVSSNQLQQLISKSC